MTGAYQIHLRHNALVMIPTHYPKDKCDTPQDAVDRLAHGFPVIIAGADAMLFHQLWERRDESAPENAG